MHATGECSISDLAEFFSVSRPTVYRTLNRRHSPYRTILPPTGIDPQNAILHSTSPISPRCRHCRNNPATTSLSSFGGCRCGCWRREPSRSPWRQAILCYIPDSDGRLTPHRNGHARQLQAYFRVRTAIVEHDIHTGGRGCHGVGGHHCGGVGPFIRWFRAGPSGDAPTRPREPE